MAGITHLSQIYHEKGKEFINKLFDKYVTINEKLDFNSFQVEKTSENKFEFKLFTVILSDVVPYKLL